MHKFILIFIFIYFINDGTKIQDQNSYCCGLIKAPSPVNNMVYFVFKIIYVLVWTYLLNLLCKKGYKTMSWVVLLLPLIAMFILVGLVIISLQRL